MSETLISSNDYKKLLGLEMVSTNVTAPTRYMWLPIRKRQLKHCMIKCVENTSRKDGESQNTWKKEKLVWFPVKDNTISNFFYKMQNLLKTSWASKIITSPIQLSIAGPLVNKLIPTIPTIPTAWGCSKVYPIISTMGQ